MIEFKIDVDQALKDTQDFFRSQVPYAISLAINATAFDVRRQVVEVTFPTAFKQRNKSFPKYAFRVTEKATKSDPVAVVGDVTGRDWLARQSDGGTKTGKTGGRVAIPVSETMRKSGGAIAKGLKPRNLKRSYVRQAGSDKKLIFERKGRGDSVLRYVLQNSAAIPAIFPFYADSERVAVTSFLKNYDDGLLKAIRSSRFFPV